MGVKGFKINPCTRQDIRDFIELNHYSGSINGCISDYCFSLCDGDKIIGAAFFGRMAMANQYKRFSDNEKEVIELRRLCCINDTPKNTESFFIGGMIKWIKRNTGIKIIVSYADADFGHEGTIYKASNFRYEGFRRGAKVIIFNGKRYHDKAIRTKHNGTLKPFAIRIKNALSDRNAFYQTTKGKHCFVYEIKRKK